MSNFVNLHVHTVYSLNDAIIDPEKAAEKAVSMGQQALAITDHGNIGGVVKFSEACSENNIKPILGMEAYICLQNPKSYNEEGDLFISESPKLLSNGLKYIDTYHTTLLAKNKVGYKNLSYLSSLGHLYGFYSKPRIWIDDILAHSEGLIMLTGCLGGYLADAVVKHIAGDNAIKNNIIEYVKRCKKSMGDDFYIEIMNSGYYKEINGKKITELDVAKELMKIGDGLGVKCVATADSHYLNKEDKMAHDIFLCNGDKYYDENTFRRVGENFLRSFDDMKDNFPSTEPITNTLEIAEKCNYSISKSDIDIPSLPGIENPQEELKKIALAGINKAWPDVSDKKRKEIKDQIDYELRVIHDLGFDNYFLITWETVNWAKNNGILVGDGRGSGSASRVARSIGITNIDPEKYGLYFERFLNPDRKSAPDFDIDFPSSYQETMFQHLIDVFGQDKVCRVATLQSLKIRSMARSIFPGLSIYNKDKDLWEEQYSKCKTEIFKHYDENIDLSIEEIHEKSDILKEALKDDVYKEKYYKSMTKMQGAKTSRSMHAGGIIVSKDPLLYSHPLCCQRKNDECFVVTQFDKDDAEFAGLLKLDFLGLKTLDIVDQAIKLINKDHKNKISIENIDLQDARVFNFLSNANTFNEVFQVNSQGMKQYIRELKPANISELSDMIALYRPGPLGAKNDYGKNMVQSFIDRKNEKEPINVLIPELKEILKDTYGVIVYQEQIIRIAKELCGWTAAKADYLRYAVGKKKTKLIEKLKPQFIKDLCDNTNHSEEMSKKLWSQIETFSRYGFNKAHSCSYAYLTYKTAYLKSLYTKYMCSAMINVRSDNHSISSKHIKEAIGAGIKIVPPRIENCSKQCKPLNNEYSFLIGMDSIKEANSKATEAAEWLAKNAGPFENLIEFVWAYVHHYDKTYISGMCSLARVGFFDSLAKKTEDGRPNRRWVEHNLKYIKKKIDGILKRKTLDEDEKKQAIFEIEMEDCDPCSIEEQYREEIYHMGFIPSNNSPFIINNKDMLDLLYSCNIKNIEEAVKISSGEDPKIKSWMHVCIACEMFSIIKSKIETIYIQDGKSIVPIITYKRSDQKLKTKMQKFCDTLKPCVVKGRIKTNKKKQNRNEFNIVDLVPMEELSSKRKIYNFIRKRNRRN